MIDFKVLESFGTTQQALRALCTAEPDGKLTPVEKRIAQAAWRRKYNRDPGGDESMSAWYAEWKKFLVAKRKQLENRISDRCGEGIEAGLRNYRFNMAADLATENAPTADFNVPLDLYAQGKINLDQAFKEIQGMCGPERAKEFFAFDEKGNPTQIDVRRIGEVAISLVRPYLTRSVAAQEMRYRNAFPFYKYEPRSNSLVGKLRADVVSQTMEGIVDSFGLRHQLGQQIRKTFMYATAPEFVEVGWVREQTLAFVPDATAHGGSRMEPVITREGIPFRQPHPTRCFFDPAYPATSLNHDNGCAYCGYWDVFQRRDIESQPGWFNTQRVPVSSSLGSHFETHRPYFDQQFPSVLRRALSQFSSQSNHRESQIGMDTGNRSDEPVWLTHYYEKISPKDLGVGHYPYPVWFHFIVAGDRTPVWAEILPSRPANVAYYNQDDDKQLNVSMVLDMLPYETATRNLFNQMVYLMRLRSFLFLVADTDKIPAEQLTAIDNLVKGGRLFEKVHMIKTSALEKDALGERPGREGKALEAITIEVGAIIQELMGGITQMIELLERNQMMSPNELGQFVQKTTTASEVQEVADSSNALHDFKGTGIQEAYLAKMRILYESWMALGSDQVRTYIPEAYPDEVIAAAGFEVEPTARGYTPRRGEGLTLLGAKSALVHEYTFAARDVGSRTISIEGAKVQMELWRYILSNEVTFQRFVEVFGMDRITESISEVFRMSGAGFILKLPSTYSELTEEQRAEALAGQIEEAIGRNQEEAIGPIEERLGTLEEAVQELLSSMMPQPPPQGAPPGAPPGMPPQGGGTGMPPPQMMM